MAVTGTDAANVSFDLEESLGRERIMFFWQTHGHNWNPECALL